MTATGSDRNPRTCVRDFGVEPMAVLRQLSQPAWDAGEDLGAGRDEL